MKHIFIFSLLLTAFLSLSLIADEVSKNPPTYYLRGRFPQGELYKKHWQTRELAQKVLDGRHIVVRLYKDWQEDPRDFERVSVQLKGLSVNCDSVKRTFGEVGNASIILVTAEDQQDEAIAAVLANFIFAEPYKKAKTFAIWADYLDHPRRKWWTFNDALGNPIGGATVEVFVGQSTDKNPRVWLKTATLDEKGRLKPHNSNSTLWNFSFILSHPDYGTAIVKPHRRIRRLDLPQSYVVPLVRIGTKADERSIWGVVVDPEKKPLGGVLIRCCVVYSPGRDYITAGGEGAYKTITDEQGRFAMYLPIEKDSDKRGNLIPPASKYFVEITPPKGLDLRYYSGFAKTGEETIITLSAKRRSGHFHTFAFEDQGKEIADVNVLKSIFILVKKGHKLLHSSSYNSWKDGGLFPLGTYQPEIYQYSTIMREFEPIEVTAESPEELVFKVKDEFTYYGQVVDGITGEPMPDVLVMTGSGTFVGRDTSSISPQQWELLHSVPGVPSASDPAAKPFQKRFYFKQITRTDETGRFRIAFKSGRDAYFSEFAAVEKDYLGAIQGRSKSNKDKTIELATMKLFPSATVVIRPSVKEKKVSVRVRWHIDPNDNPPWANQLLSCYKNLQLMCNNLLWANRVHSFHVPAGLNMSITLYPVDNGRWSQLTIEGIKAEQGQRLDLGHRELQPTLRVSVKAIDSANEPVEGVSVTCATQGGLSGQRSISNENGVAFFGVPPHSKGRFSVYYRGGRGDPVRPFSESITYEIGGEKDVGRQFTLQLSDEMLYQLFK